MDNLVVCLLSSTLAASIVVAAKELWLWKLNRKAKLEDDHKEGEEQDKEMNNKIDANRVDISEILDLLKALDKKVDSTANGSRIILKDRIKYIGLSYISKGSVTYDERATLHEMWSIYHNDLGGNGDLNDLMGMVDKLPVTVN